MIPDPCPTCAPHGGYWVPDETGSAWKRCGCARGDELAKIAAGVARPPAISGEEAVIFANMLGSMKFYPGDAESRSLIGGEIRSMCASSNEAQWLVRTVARSYREWPGIAELRIVYCAHGKQPLDGLPSLGTSEYYPNGFPTQPARVPSPETKLLGGPPTDPELAGAVEQLAIAKGSPTAPARRRHK